MMSREEWVSDVRRFQMRNTKGLSDVLKYKVKVQSVLQKSGRLVLTWWVLQKKVSLFKMSMNFQVNFTVGEKNRKELKKGSVTVLSLVKFKTE